MVNVFFILYYSIREHVKKIVFLEDTSAKALTPLAPPLELLADIAILHKFLGAKLLYKWLCLSVVLSVCLYTISFSNMAIVYIMKNDSLLFWETNYSFIERTT